MFPQEELGPSHVRSLASLAYPSAPLVCRAAPSLLAPPPLAGDWVQNLPDTAAATTKWGDIGNWNVGNVKDFRNAFSVNRNEAGGSGAPGGNSKAGEMNGDLSKWTIAKVTTLHSTFYGAAKFTGKGLASWDTAAVTTLLYTFNGASEMNSDLSGWKVGKVVTLDNTFTLASKFAGTGLDSWDTAAVTTLFFTFSKASEMNSDLSKWTVAKVTTLQSTFYGAIKFTGMGLASWDISSVTTLYYTFYAVGQMNSDLSGWNVGKVTTLERTFKSASKFAGTGLSSWITNSVTTLFETFKGAGEMNANIGGWAVGEVTTLVGTFNSMSKFTGTGLGSWDISKVKDMDYTFEFATSLASCNKRKIADAWASSTVFAATTYPTDWAADSCAVKVRVDLECVGGDYVEGWKMVCGRWCGGGAR